MRIDSKTLTEITGYKRKLAQVRWFLQHLGADVPFDRKGLILTDETYQKLLEKRLGLGASLSPLDKARPALRP